MSELSALTWALLTLYAAMRCNDRPAWAIICGAAYSMAVLVRPTDIFLAFSILLASELRAKRLAWLALGSMPGGLLLLYLNWRLHGSPFTTGQVGLLRVFSIAYVPHNLAHFGRWTFLLLGPTVLCALVLFFFPRFRCRDYAIQAAWVLSLVSFYAFYFDAGGIEWWWLRYLLPAFPSLIILVVAGVRAIWTYLTTGSGSTVTKVRAYLNGRVLTMRGTGDEICFLKVFVKRHRGWKPFLLIHVPKLRQPIALYAVATAIVLMSFGWEAVAVRRVNNGEIFWVRENSKIYSDAPNWTRDKIRNDAIIVCSDFSGAFYYYTDFIVLNYDTMDKAKISEFIVAARTRSQPMYAVVAEYEVNGEDVHRTEAWRLFVDAWRRAGGETKLLSQLDARHFVFEFIHPRNS
jgi:hypothetical protein